MKVFTVKGPSLKELYVLSKDTEITVSRTPFGANPLAGEEKVYIKKAVPWKGVKGIENLKRVNPKVAETINKLRQVSKAMKGRYKGVAVVAINGRIKAMPYKSFMQMVAAGKADKRNLITEWMPAEKVPVDTYVDRAERLLGTTIEIPAI